jgi:hypothetical protein
VAGNTRPIADTSLPFLTDGRIVVRQPERDVSYEEDRLTPWRALAVFGGLALADDVVFAMVGTSGTWIGLGILFLPIFLPILVIVSAATNVYYGMSVLGAYVLFLALYSGAGSVLGMQFLESVVLLGGSILLILGVLRDEQISLQIDPDRDY